MIPNDVDTDAASTLSDYDDCLPSMSENCSKEPHNTIIAYN